MQEQGEAIGGLPRALDGEQSHFLAVQRLQQPFERCPRARSGRLRATAPEYRSAGVGYRQVEPFPTVLDKKGSPLEQPVPRANYEHSSGEGGAYKNVAQRRSRARQGRRGLQSVAVLGGELPSRAVSLSRSSAGSNGMLPVGSLGPIESTSRNWADRWRRVSTRSASPFEATRNKMANDNIASRPAPIEPVSQKGRLASAWAARQLLPATLMELNKSIQCRYLSLTPEDCGGELGKAGTYIYRGATRRPGLVRRFHAYPASQSAREVTSRQGNEERITQAALVDGGVAFRKRSNSASARPSKRFDRSPWFLIAVRISLRRNEAPSMPRSDWFTRT